MASAVERVIEESLEGLERGRSIEEILVEYPIHNETLRPVLATASGLLSLKIAHSVGAQSNSLEQFLSAASAKSAQSFGSTRVVWSFGRRMAVSFSAMLILLFIVSLSLTLAAQPAVPGDALYGTKMTIEDIRLAFVRERIGRDRLKSEFNQNRIEELEELIASGRSASGIEIRGRIESIDGEVWVISGVAIKVSDSLGTGGRFEIGQDVIVVTDVGNGDAEATKIVRASRLDIEPEVEPLIIEEPQEEVEPDIEALPTVNATRTLTAAPTETLEPTTATPNPNGFADP